MIVSIGRYVVIQIVAVLLLGVFGGVAQANIFDDLAKFNKANRRQVRDQLQNFFEVDAGKFYRSQQLAPSVLKAYIKRFGIKTLINLRGVNETVWYQTEKEVADTMGVVFHSIAMSAVTISTKNDLEQLLKLYDEAERPILVHCLGGADRTGEAAALWVLEVQEKSKEEALRQLSITYGHRKFVNSAKDFLIQIWGGRQWLARDYNHRNYPWFCRE
jgi:undecaprenyl-diphosphatase